MNGRPYMKATESRNSVSKAYCHLCGKSITGRYKTYRHKKWPQNMHLRVCASCEKTKPHCEVCRIPMADRSQNRVCKTCSETQEFCLTCGKPILGKSLEFDGVGPYCPICVAKRQPCNVCSAPITDERWMLSDGRVLCAFCNASAILTKEQANSLYEQMKSVVKTILGLSLNVPTGLALVDRTQLAKVVQGPNSIVHSNGEAISELEPNRTLGLYVRKGMRRALYIQTGLPRLLFLQVAAHEFAHAWEGENCPLLKTPIYHEGFAEWVAYQVIGNYGYTKGQKRMLSREDVYGDGLRFFQDIFTRAGFSGVIEVCKKTD